MAFTCAYFEVFYAWAKVQMKSTFGNAVREFASDNAIVVVGTVIDPDMSGEMRVTIVATGIGQGTPNVEVISRNDAIRNHEVEQKDLEEQENEKKSKKESNSKIELGCLVFIICLIN